MNQSHQTVGRRSMGLLLLATGLIGFGLGAFVFPTDHYCVEFGQVLAGVVKYPPEAAQGLILRHFWSLPILLSALGLLAGFCESTLSFLISGLVGMLSFQALSLFIFAINNRLWIAILAPLLIFYSQATSFGGVYEVMLMGFWVTHGVVGLAYVLFLIAIFGVGWNRTGALLLGMSPAWHTVIGCLMWIVVLMAWVLNSKKPWKQNLPILGWFLTGVSIALVSFGVQRIEMPPLPEIASDVVNNHLSSFIQNWDSHRQPVAFSSPELLLNFLGLAVCFTYLTKHSSSIPERLRLIFKLLLIAGSSAVVFGLLTRLPVSWLPLDYTRIMPARLLNVFVISYAAIILGILTREGNQGPEPLLALVFIILLLIAFFSPPTIAKTFVLVTLVLGGVIILLMSTGALLTLDLTIFRDLRSLLARSQLLILVGFAGLILAQNRAFFSWEAFLKDRAASLASNEKSETSETGLVLTASVFTMAQYYTRKPILLDVSQLDALCYAPRLAPAAAAILHDLYGIDFFDPPVGSRHQGGVWPGGLERNMWESWPVEKWKDVRAKYQVAEVLVPADWRLQLPAARTARVRYTAEKRPTRDGLIYHIPAGPSPPTR